MMIKELIKQLHAGASPEEVKERFKHVLATISPLEISVIEQELVSEGMPREEIQRLCDVHLLVFQEQLEKQKPQVPPENPVNILMEEHKAILQILEKLNATVNNVQRLDEINQLGEDLTELKNIKEDFLDSEKHYLREENVLFPIIEKHGITEPPAMMWTEHNQIRELKKQFYNLIENYSAMNFRNFKDQLNENAKSLTNILSTHFFKENNILFPAALRVVTNEEWSEVREEFAKIGYCRFTPQHLIAATVPQTEKFETGTLSKNEIEALFKTIPVDITFVDKDDYVRYFSKSEIFLRTKAVIGRKVQQCHPQKSIHVVNGILESFKSGKRDVAEFWIQMKNRMIHIRYFAVRDINRNYLGTMEVTQDITDIKKIEGEKRLLDWKE